MSSRAILFDLDGTLVDTVGPWISSYIETLDAFGVEMTTERFLGTIYRRNRSLDKVLGDLGVDDVDGFRARRDERYLEALREAAWLPGSLDVLRRARDVGPIGIVTAAWKSYVDRVDEVLGVRAHVSTIVTADDVIGEGKPHPRGLLLGAERLGVEASSCWYVGDQPFDIEAAHRAGMTSCLVSTQHAPSDAALGEYTPHRFVAHLDELTFD